MNKKKSIIDEYDPVIYPRKLWVCKNVDTKKLNSVFSLVDGSCITSYDADDTSYMWTMKVKHRKTGYYGVMVVVLTDKTDKIEDVASYAAHEAVHVEFNIFEDIDLSVPTSAQEASCYLAQWATKCIMHTALK